MKIESLGSGAHARAFYDLPTNKRIEIISSIHGSFEEAVHLINGRLELPDAVQFRITDSKFYSAQAMGKLVNISLNARGHFASANALVGLVAHEISHVVDTVTGNGARRGCGKRRRIISEGKAEVLGVELGGADYVDARGVRILIGHEKDLAYRNILNMRASRIGDDRERRNGRHRRQRECEPTPHYNSGFAQVEVVSDTNPYPVGYTLISDVLRLENASIYDVHPWEIDDFIDLVPALHALHSEES